ncbi:MAG TPA: hypothetical protein DDY18_06160 [Flavobacterium sp.]|jgi:hypothetical protein|nr:hypothetical protein [Flavobacterium sp.]
MSKNKWMKELNRMEGAVDREYNPYLLENTIQTVSPSLNWTFSKSAGLSFMEFLLLWGQPKAGKSIVSDAFVSALHAKDKDAMAMKFDTEMREMGHKEPFWNIDEERYPVFNANEPQLIFDRLTKDVFPMVEEGMPLKLVIIDSLQGIQGVKAANADSVTDHQMGDHAMTIQKGLMAISPFLRRHKIALIATAHVRGNLDAGMYGPKEKMAGGWHQKHSFEYYMKVSRDNSADGKKDALGNALETDTKDFKDKAERTGHKIYVEMTESSRGVAGRSGQFTFDYNKGIVNTEEEILKLSVNMGFIERPNNVTYIMGDKNFKGKEAVLTEIRDNKALQKNLLERIYGQAKGE